MERSGKKIVSDGIRFLTDFFRCHGDNIAAAVIFLVFALVVSRSFYEKDRLVLTLNTTGNIHCRLITDQSDYSHYLPATPGDRIVQLYFPAGNVAAPEKWRLEITAAPDTQINLRVISLLLREKHYYFSHAQIGEAFIFATPIEICDSSNGAAFHGKQVLVPVAKKMTGSQVKAPDIPCLPFAHWITCCAYVLTLFAGLLIALQFRSFRMGLRHCVDLRHWAPKLVLLSVLLLSLVLFLYFLRENYNSIRCDQGGYWLLAQHFSGQTLSNADQYLELRTYFYPFSIAVVSEIVGIFFSPFAKGEFFPAVKISVSILQYLMLCGLCLYYLRRLNEYFNSSYSWMSIAAIAGILLNPWVIQATTLLLTDLSSACCVGFAFAQLILNKNKPSTRQLFAGGILLAAAGCIRPSGFIFVPLYLIVYLFISYFRKKSFRDFAADGIVFAIIFCCCCLPQIFQNYSINQNPIFPICRNLKTQQEIYSIKFLKYSTLRDETDRAAPLYFNNPHYKNTYNGSSFLFCRDNPWGYYWGKGLHIPAAILQGELNSFDTYVRPGNLYLALPVKLIYASYWAVALLGLVFGILKIREFRFAGTMFAIPIIGFMYVLVNSAVESRFIYPVLLLLPPLFCGGWLYWQNGSRTVRIFSAVTVMFIILLFIAGDFYIDSFRG